MLLCLLFTGVLFSCEQKPGPDNAQLLTAEQLKAYVYGPKGLFSTVFTGVFYAGSDDSFDYVAIKRRDISTTLLRVRRGGLPITRRFPVVSNPKAWVDITKEYPFPAGGRAQR